ncbi:hypothetical protein AHAS_AhasUnG0044500 [Arachis hypogaea]
MGRDRARDAGGEEKPSSRVDSGFAASSRRRGRNHHRRRSRAFVPGRVAAVVQGVATSVHQHRSGKKEEPCEHQWRREPLLRHHRVWVLLSKPLLPPLLLGFVVVKPSVAVVGGAAAGVVGAIVASLVGATVAGERERLANSASGF